MITHVDWEHLFNCIYHPHCSRGPTKFTLDETYKAEIFQMKIVYINRPGLKFIHDSNTPTLQEGSLNPPVSVDIFKLSIGP